MVCGYELQTFDIVIHTLSVTTYAYENAPAAYTAVLNHVNNNSESYVSWH